MEQIQKNIEDSFRKQVQSDVKLKNAYLLADSDKLGIHIGVAEGTSGDKKANIKQPNYMASVGKLFTATLIGILYEKGKLAYGDKLDKYLDEELLDGLHVFKGIDHSGEITVEQLLNHTSGLYDCFWPLFEKLRDDHSLSLSPREALEWGKQHLKPLAPPGKKFSYSDTNYYLLGFIIEKIMGLPFHEALKEYIFRPLQMNNSYMLHYSEPLEDTEYPLANFYGHGINFTEVKGLAGIDYAGGGVVAPMHDLLKFMKALVEHKIVQKETLEQMKDDTETFSLGIGYGYGIWKFRAVPLLTPKKFTCWGVAGVIGAFMFFHPGSEAYIIGNFNDLSYKSKALRFMLLKVIKQLG
jgi:D-alanyl-D-alanine carboxypeptidase